MQQNGTKIVMDDVKSFMSYAKQSPDNVYVCSSFHSVMPFEGVPGNTLFWGGCIWKSGLHEKHLAMMGLDKADFHIFERENVYFVTYRKDLLEWLYKILSEKYGCKGYGLKYITDGHLKIAVYDFEY
jgi:hypothetical protein